MWLLSCPTGFPFSFRILRRLPDGNCWFSSYSAGWEIALCGGEGERERDCGGGREELDSVNTHEREIIGR